MSCSIRLNETTYALQGVLDVYLNRYDRTVASYSVIVGKRFNLLHILKYLILNLNNPDFVNVEFQASKKESEKSEKDDEDKIPTAFIELCINREDIPLLSYEAPIRIKCFTDAFPNNKVAFEEFLKELYDVMKY